MPSAADRHVAPRRAGTRCAAGLGWLLILLSGCDSQIESAPRVDTARDRRSYALGYSVGTGFAGVGLEQQSAQLRQGLLDGLAGDEREQLSRPELALARRRTARRLHARELDALSARIDAEQDR